jgi:hypothetical protein
MIPITDKQQEGTQCFHSFSHVLIPEIIKTIIMPVLNTLRKIVAILMSQMISKNGIESSEFRRKHLPRLRFLLGLRRLLLLTSLLLRRNKAKNAMALLFGETSGVGVGDVLSSLTKQEVFPSNSFTLRYGELDWFIHYDRCGGCGGRATNENIREERNSNVRGVNKRAL